MFSEKNFLTEQTSPTCRYINYRNKLSNLFHGGNKDELNRKQLFGWNDEWILHCHDQHKKHWNFQKQFLQHMEVSQKIS